jgi:dihydrofolate synthase / folylpolyglutamate synthase
MIYEEAIKFLYSLQLFGTKLGLENTFKLAALAGNPQEKLRFIHVAGTNGKGSTCAMLESIYRAAGLRTGLFTSPHLVSFGERIQVNREPISRADVARLAGEMQRLLAQFPADAHPTFFEIVTVMALKYFAEQKCELVIWETGLGGRLDATNIVTPLASIITNIQLDHQAWLGDTLAKIAAEKAGIIKPGVPVITAVDERESFRVLFEAARKNGSPFWLITWTQSEYPPLKGLALPLLGEHQWLNAAVATYAVKALAKKIPVSNEIIRAGLLNVRWPGRLQLAARPDGKKVLLDGAHNVGGAEALRTALKTYFAAEKITLVLGILQDKDCREICEILAPLARRIVATPVNSKRTALAQEVARACRAANSKAEIVEASSLKEALKLAEKDEFLVIAGSLYLIGDAMELLGLSSGNGGNEQKLNEWSGQPVQGDTRR